MTPLPPMDPLLAADLRELAFAYLVVWAMWSVGFYVVLRMLDRHLGPR